MTLIDSLKSTLEQATQIGLKKLDSEPRNQTGWSERGTTRLIQKLGGWTTSRIDLDTDALNQRLRLDWRETDAWTNDSDWLVETDDWTNESWLVETELIETEFVMDWTNDSDVAGNRGLKQGSLIDW